MKFDINTYVQSIDTLKMLFILHVTYDILFIHLFICFVVHHLLVLVDLVGLVGLVDLDLGFVQRIVDLIGWNT